MVRVEPVLQSVDVAVGGGEMAPSVRDGEIVVEPDRRVPVRVPLVVVTERDGVVRLQVALCVRGRQERGDVDVVTGLGLLVLGEPLRVVVVERLLLRRVDGRSGELVEARGEPLDGL